MVSEEDYCELLEKELAQSGDKAGKYCELCELQRANEKMISEIMGVDIDEIKKEMKK